MVTFAEQSVSERSPFGTKPVRVSTLRRWHTGGLQIHARPSYIVIVHISRGMDATTYYYNKLPYCTLYFDKISVDTEHKSTLE